MGVYFIQCNGSGGPVKIGNSCNVKMRLAALQLGCPYPLTVIRTIEGGATEERWLQTFFAELKMRGEWFRFSADMTSIVPPLGQDDRIEKIKQMRREGLPFRVIGARLGMTGSGAHALFRSASFDALMRKAA